MKNRIRFLSALLLFCLLFSLVCLLSGCGSDSSSGSSKGEGKAPGDSGVHIAEDSSKGKVDGLLTEEKIIRTARLTLETTAYDTALPALKQSVVKAGGYLESAPAKTEPARTATVEMPHAPHGFRKPIWTHFLPAYRTIR